MIHYTINNKMWLNVKPLLREAHIIVSPHCSNPSQLSSKLSSAVISCHRGTGVWQTRFHKQFQPFHPQQLDTTIFYWSTMHMPAILLLVWGHLPSNNFGLKVWVIVRRVKCDNIHLFPRVSGPEQLLFLLSCLPRIIWSCHCSAHSTGCSLVTSAVSHIIQGSSDNSEISDSLKHEH